MYQKIKDIQKRYDGFLQTNNLWKNNDVFELYQFKIHNKFSKIDILIDEKLRLGKYIERFVSFELSQNKSIEILAENIQIQRNKITLGELDCLLLKDKSPVHLEIIYKFYLFDDKIGNTEIEHFIGPNRKDALIEKLSKLKDKQLPILHTKECKNLLNNFKIELKDISQQIYFKAQLFLPIYKTNINLKLLNKNCITGFYCNLKDLHRFNNCKFFIPIKKDWIIIPHKNVDWLQFSDFKKEVTPILERQFSPLCWLKKENGEIEKFFLVWWT
ncbi:DUF1853 family protein [uncultured Polaribacter sp.]|uniref:DUF1853 family protein n=1 Tax=uncultured Polaribacter sp. TaxID=174711 RepID=UPI00261613C4|nr:DUF1853 family protein [uncultured Polaribacter sp.]